MFPTNIDTKYVKTYTRRPFDDVDELVYVLTWPDGSVTERHTIPPEWHGLYVECVNARQAAIEAERCPEAAAWVASIGELVSGRAVA